ncbi:MAG: UDP-N-acetylglucosamine diphosphorylase/glucosamine-1-phosphate N-acetyltransferase [Betaproteobacteria bacterium RIFCSPLOWO2_02_FULL_62_17]|nr:MAG: UDP-N-acetylglucosamine diphosphorylase/glucosamine-1-phosphate N-acetyltransferase [Betaproteobacteria bacterium RIFCSPLOWO2_02_FULL_62_17]
MNIVILAAGQGKRMYSDVPKVLHCLGGKSLLMHVFEVAKSLDPARICVIDGHGGDMVRLSMAGQDVIWARQDPQLGTGHAVMQAIPHLDEKVPTLVLYGDVPMIRAETLRRLEGAAGDELGLLTVGLQDPAGYGRIVRQGGVIVRIVEEKDASEAERRITEVNTGVIMAPTAKLKDWLARLSDNNAQREYYLTDVVAMAAADGVRIGSAQPAESWETLGVNSRLQLAQLERVRRELMANALMKQGVTLIDPARIDIRGTLVCGRDCAIDVNCVFEGEVVLADRVSIGAGCLLRDVHVDSDTRIDAFCHLNEAKIGTHCRIGPYARIRPGTILSKEVHIGNFVEVKASNIGEGSKANHLSYIGDSDVGSNVNIGAGTITCNYDGVNKHRTVIEDDVFIGSDTQLVAPVRVGKGATLGAGTTLTRDAPEGQLTISRSPQTTISKWSRPEKKKG